MGFIAGSPKRKGWRWKGEGKHLDTRSPPKGHPPGSPALVPFVPPSDLMSVSSVIWPGINVSQLASASYFKAFPS